MRQHKIAIVGAGLVGGSAALLAAYSIPGVEIVEPVRAEGQVLDLAHAAAIWRSADCRAGAVGYVTRGEWWRAGFIVSVVYLAIWLFIGPLWWMLLGYVYDRFGAGDPATVPNDGMSE